MLNLIYFDAFNVPFLMGFNVYINVINPNKCQLCANLIKMSECYLGFHHMGIKGLGNCLNRSVGFY